jgi:hypothetical protein
MFRARVCLWRQVLFSATICLAATSTLGKGKPPQPDPEPPTPPVNYAITWLRAESLYDRTDLHDVDGTGSTAVGRVVIGGSSHAIAMDVATGTVSHLSDEVGNALPPGWQLTTGQEVNNRGRIAGQLMDDLGGTHLFVYDRSDLPNSFQVINGGSTVLDMNEAGDLLYAKHLSSDEQLFGIFTHNQQSLALPDSLGTTRFNNISLGSDGGPLAISDVESDGVVRIAGNLSGHWESTSAYIFEFDGDPQSGTMTMIDPYFRAFEIGGNGTVVGRGALKSKGAANTGFLTASSYTAEDGKVLLDEEKSSSEARATNAFDQVTGVVYGKTNSIPMTAFVYDPTDGFWAVDELFNNLSPEDAEMWSTGYHNYSFSVGGMSEPLVAGYPMIVGSKLAAGTTLGFILTPAEVPAIGISSIPEPTSLVLLGFGALAIFGRRPFRTIAPHRFTSILTGIFAIGTATAFAQPFTLSRTIDDPTPTEWDYFSQSLQIYGNHILVGAPFDDTDGENVGQAYLFDATSGELVTTFHNPSPKPVFEFGESEYFASLRALALDGDRVLIGAPWDDTKGDKVGQAYLFDAETGDLLHTFDDPTVTRGDRFGSAVALDGNHVLIGAIGDDTNGNFAGQAHLFDATTGALLHTFDDPTPTELGAFGVTLAIDGHRVLIGADEDHLLPGLFSGQVYLFDTSGSLLQTFDNPSPELGDRFGDAVSLDGSRVLIGASFDDTNGENVGQAYLFDATSGALLQTFDDPTPSTNPGFNVGDSFGSSLAMDGRFVLIGAPGDDSYGVNVGQAHLFDRTTGELLQTLDDPNPTSIAVDPGCCFVGDRFGFAVALDGGRALVGAMLDDTNGENVGQAHLFTAVSELSADFDGDGDVDEHDLLFWQANFGTIDQDSPPRSMGNADGDWDVDGADFLIWQASLSSPSVPAAAVPEPSGILTAVLCLLGFTRRPCQPRASLS